jgi:hypothetical protein
MPLDEEMEALERMTRAICTLNDGGYCECVGYSLGCKVGRGEPPEIGLCKMTAEALPLTAEYRMAAAALRARSKESDNG